MKAGSNRMKVPNSKIKLNKDLLNKAIIVICIITLIYSLSKIGIIYYDSFRNKNLITGIQGMFYNQQQFKAKTFRETSFDKVLRSIVLNESESTSTDINNLIKQETLMKYDQLLEINEDIVGWIKVPNTKIDYPVMQSSDNLYYLDKAINLEKNRAGSIFMDFRNGGDGEDKHTILYGHHMRDGTMFKGLIKYENEDFFNNQSIIQFDTLFEEQKWEVFSAYVTGVGFDYLKTNFNTPDEYKTFLTTIQEKSLFPSDVVLTENDQILTLSTCTYDYSEARLVVHAKKIE